MEHDRHIKILYGLVALLVVGMAAIGVVWYQSQKESNVPPPSPSADLTGVVVGGADLPPLTVVGTITAISSNTMKVKGSDGSGVDTVAITAGTQFELLGPPKDSTAMQKEYNDYNAQVAELMKDPQKNKAALAALRAPIPQTLLPATLADFAVGDQVQINASSTDATGAYVATLILNVGSQ